MAVHTRACALVALLVTLPLSAAESANVARATNAASSEEALNLLALSLDGIDGNMEIINDNIARIMNGAPNPARLLTDACTRMHAIAGELTTGIYRQLADPLRRSVADDLWGASGAIRSAAMDCDRAATALRRGDATTGGNALIVAGRHLTRASAMWDPVAESIKASLGGDQTRG